FQRARREREFAEELESHLQMHIEDNLRAGMSPEEARRLALIKLGGVAQITELHREQRGLPMLETLLQDLRFGLRLLRKNPGFSLIAILTLALGIGANTAIFSVANGVLLKPLPYKDPERLAFIRTDWRGVSGQAGIAAAEVIDFRRQSKLFEGFEVIMRNNASLTGEPMEKVRGATVTERFLPLLGVRPFLGSLPDKVGKVWDVVISYELWQRRFGGDQQIIGQKIEVNNFNPTVVGVMPPGFR